LCLEVQEQARELDVRIAETVDDGDAVMPENLTRLRRRRSRNEQQMAVLVGLMHELPGGRGVGALLDLDHDGLGTPGEPEHGVAPPAPRSRPRSLDGDTREVT